MAVRRETRGYVIFGFIYAIVDLFLVSILFVHGKDFHYHFAIDFYNYTFGFSMCDLWILSLLRFSVISGATLGLMYNPKDAVPRIKKVNIIIICVAVVMWTYPMLKLLLYAEHVTNLKKPWFWSLFAWSLVSSVIFYVLWDAIGSIKLGPTLREPFNVNANEEEREPFIEDEEDGEEEKKKKKENNDLSTGAKILRLLKYSIPDWPFLLTAFFFLLICSTAEIFLPYFTGKVIDGIAIRKSTALFTKYIIIMGVIAGVSAIAAGLRGGFFKVAVARLNIRLRSILFSSLVKQEIGFFDNSTTGEITSRLTSDTTTMSDALGINTNVFLRNVVKGVGCCVFMFKLSWQLSMVTVMGLPIIMGVSWIYGEFYENLEKKVQDSLADANTVAEETCSSMRTVRSFANETAESQRYRDKLRVTFKLKLKEAAAYAGYTWCTELFGLALIVATLYYGGHLVVRNEISGGNLVSFILYQLELSFTLESIGEVFTGLMQAVGASEKVFEFIDRKPHIPNTGKLVPASLEGHLEFKNVSFKYPSRPDTEVLKSVSFSVQPGEVVALVGPSGGGKSTCVNLLEHFYETQEGEVLLDSVPIQEYDHSFLHKKVALVGQEPILYNRSIKENIAYGLERWDLPLVQHAAQLANAHQFIMDMKKAYETETGEKGLRLSGGQKQRIAIARALIRNPTVLLLDEATSALDAESEYVVQQAIYNNVKGRTVIIIAHRLSTVERADRIIVIEKGLVAEQGTHKELLEKSGLYARLVQRQLLGFDHDEDHRKRKNPVRLVSQESMHSRDSDDDEERMKYGSPKFGSLGGKGKSGSDQA